jgi:hypothetical protein
MGVLVRIDRVLVGVLPLVDAFVDVAAEDDVGVDALVVLEGDDVLLLLLLSVEETRPEAEELGFFVAVDMTGM